MNTNPQAEFVSRCENKQKDGLVDLKYCVAPSIDFTPNAFCEEANAIDDTLMHGDYEPLVLNDSKK